MKLFAWILLIVSYFFFAYANEKNDFTKLCISGTLLLISMITAIIFIIIKEV